MRRRLGRSLLTILPAGMGSVALGVALSGISAYVFLALTARAFGPVDYAPLATFWSFAFVIGPGCFSVLEKETGRLISAGLVLEDHTGPVLRQAVVLGACLTGVLIIGFGATSHVAVERLFAGNWAVFAAFLVSLVAMCAQFLGLGVLAGNSRFAGYGVLTGSEGVLRLAGAGMLLAIGNRSVGWFGLVIALAPALALVVVYRPLANSSLRGEALGLGAMTRSMSWLLVGTLFSTVLVGSGPITVQLLGGGHQRALTSRFLSALVLVRVPLFLYNSAVATLLPALAGHLAGGEVRLFRRMLNRLIIMVLIVGGASVVGAWVLGPSVMTAVFGAHYKLPGPDLALLAGASAAMMISLTFSIALTAAGEPHRLAFGWALGVGVMIAVTAAVHPLLLRVELGLLAGSIASTLGMLPPLYGRRRFRTNDDTQLSGSSLGVTNPA